MATIQCGEFTRRDVPRGVPRWSAHLTPVPDESWLGAFEREATLARRVGVYLGDSRITGDTVEFSAEDNVANAIQSAIRDVIAKANVADATKPTAQGWAGDALDPR